MITITLQRRRDRAEKSSMQSTPRMPLPSPPEEPGWWLAVDGRWYPPESAPAPAVTNAPAAPTAPAITAAPAAPIGPPLGSPGGAAWQSRGPVPPLPPPTLGRAMTTAARPTSAYNTPAGGGEATAIVSLVLGIVALVCSFWIIAAIGMEIGIFVDLALGLTSLFLGISAFRRNGNGLAIAGITLGAVASAFSGLVILNFLRMYATYGRVF